MCLLLRVAIFSLFSNNFLDLGGLLCLLVLASLKALVHPQTLSLLLKENHEISKHLFEWLYFCNRCNLI